MERVSHMIDKLKMCATILQTIILFPNHGKK